MRSDTESGHASSEDLAAYLSRTLSAEDRATVEKHLAECESCRDELSAAQDLLSRRKRPMQMGGAVALAAAALALVLVVRSPSSRVETTQNAPLTRGNAAVTNSVTVIEPQDGALTADSAILFRWAAMSDDAHYRVTLMNEAGDALWSAETLEPQITLPPTVRLKGGTRYLWYVDATRPAGDSASTGPTSFQTK